MANIWLDRENAVNMPPQSAKLSGLGHLSASSATKLSTKKNVLGNINNIIHNKQSATTPFNGSRSLKSDFYSASTKSLCNDVLRNQQRKQNFREAQKSLEKNMKSMAAATTTAAFVNKRSLLNDFDDDMFHYMDFPQAFCAENCKKGLSEIWSESHTFDDNTIMQLVNSFPEKRDVDENDIGELKAGYCDYVDDVEAYDFDDFKAMSKQATCDDDSNMSETPTLPDFNFSF